MANFKIVNDEELNIPIAVSTGNTSDTIDAIYKNRSTSGPTKVTNKPIKASEAAKGNIQTTIDVVNNYDWKASPDSNLIEHPYILLHEYRIRKSPMLAQLMYVAKASVENSSAAVKGVANLNSVLSKLGEFYEGTADKIEGIIELLEESYGGLGSGEDFGDVLKPFEGLYYTDKTDFTYKLPYFSNSMTQKKASWDRDYPGDANIFSDLIKKGQDFVATYSAGVPIFGSYAEPGVYIERGKYFQPRPGDNPITFNFPLLNTINSESIQKNFNLIWLLSFQNSPIRKNKTDVYPPCIYKALIPGVRFMQFCSLENISIKYLGTRRRIPIVHPASGQTIETIIPEAYQVNITINSLTTDNGNFMLKSLSDSL